MRLIARSLGLCLLTLPLACDAEAPSPEGELGGASGKADLVDECDATPTATDEVEALIMEYWLSWQRDDFEAFRATLADDVRVDLGFAKVEGADAVTAISQAGHPFRDVELVAADFHPGGGTIVYTAIDDVTDQPLRMSELVTVSDGLITEVTGVLLTEPAPRVSTNLPFDEDALQAFPGDPDGPRARVVYGDPQGGPSGQLIWTTRDMEATPHDHTHGYHAVVIQGVVRNAPDIDYAPDMPPGSYWVQAGGETHVTKCMSEEPCISLVMFDGPFDITPPGGT